MSDADCTPGREPRSVAASLKKHSWQKRRAVLVSWKRYGYRERAVERRTAWFQRCCRQYTSKRLHRSVLAVRSVDERWSHHVQCDRLPQYCVHQYVTTWLTRHRCTIHHHRHSLCYCPRRLTCCKLLVDWGIAEWDSDIAACSRDKRLLRQAIL